MNLLSALSVSASGMSAQRQRTELLVENLANSDTTRTPEGGPYRRKDVVFAADPSAAQFSSLFENEINGSAEGVRREAGRRTKQPTPAQAMDEVDLLLKRHLLEHQFRPPVWR